MDRYTEPFFYDPDDLQVLPPQVHGETGDPGRLIHHARHR
jgi:hypothetical protein